MYLQLRDVKRSIRVATHAAIYEQAAEFRSHLVEYPDLRKYFFDGVEISAADENYSRVMTLAEIFLNYLEHIAVLGESFGSENKPALELFIRTALKSSPILRQHLTESPELYSDSLRQISRG
ncbi:MAG: hypothetical protein ACRDJC_24090 [Thermomicrobiales bacterium]